MSNSDSVSGNASFSDVGLIMVHGIGEQGRFEHLNAHIRGVIQGLRRGGASVTVEIVSGPAAAFQATQDSWGSGAEPSVRLIVQQGGERTKISVHEVWWADVNERYSLMKQLRFWRWGLSISGFRPYYSAGLPTSGSMFPPRFGSPDETRRKLLGARIRLFGIGCFFLITSLTLGLGSVLLKRLLNLEPPDVVKVFANYLSSIKLYNQPRREGVAESDGGADFLDNLGVPPRFSIRRRMIRAIADVACRNYGRWYIMAHSQGAVVAFNGLMEPAYGWLGYLDEERWLALRNNKMSGRGVRGLPADSEVTMPPRPVWVLPKEIIYRRQVFKNFRGLLTYGCPLEKFATIWPATVAVCREPAFTNQPRWLNVMDPLDPVSGVMVRWPTEAPECCPKPENVGYASSSVLLLGHIKYLSCPMVPAQRGSAGSCDTDRLADRVACWLRTDRADQVLKATGRFFPTDAWRAWWRGRGAWAQWIFAFLLADLAGGWFMPWTIRTLGRGILALARGIDSIDYPVWMIWLFSPVQTFLAHGFRWLGTMAIQLGSMSWLFWLIALPAASAVITILFSVWLHATSETRGAPSPPESMAFSPIDPPDPP